MRKEGLERRGAGSMEDGQQKTGRRMRRSNFRFYDWKLLFPSGTPAGVLSVMEELVIQKVGE